MESNLKHLALSDNGFLFDTISGHTYTLNKVGISILRELMAGSGRDAVIAALTERYDVTAEAASRDVDEFFIRLKDIGITH
jgi:hypothetical protein